MTRETHFGCVGKTKWETSWQGFRWQKLGHLHSCVVVSGDPEIGVTVFHCREQRREGNMGNRDPVVVCLTLPDGVEERRKRGILFSSLRAGKQ